MGQIITFYSYKGGVGRSMALANVAVLLSQWGYKVLIIDWDIEAPGIEHFFENYSNIDLNRNKDKKGIIDLFGDSHNNSKLILNWKDLVSVINLPESSIDIILSGKKSEDYFTKLRDLDWREFYNEKAGGFFIETLRNEWKNEYDFILIDSRTGITDIGGICTIQLPDILVLMFTSTNQSLNGVIKIANRANKKRQELPIDRFNLISIPIPSKFDTSKEFIAANEWLDIFTKNLQVIYSNWLEKDSSIRNFLENTKLPYIPYFSFGEKIAVLEKGEDDPVGLGYAYQNLTALIANNLESANFIYQDRDKYVRAASIIGASYFTEDVATSLLEELSILKNIVKAEVILPELNECLIKLKEVRQKATQSGLLNDKYEVDKRKLLLEHIIEKARKINTEYNYLAIHRQYDLLIIEDNKMWLDLLSELLSGFSYDTVESVEKAIEKMNINRYKLICSSLEIGTVQNGKKFLNYLKEHHFNIPVILITGHYSIVSGDIENNLTMIKSKYPNIQSIFIKGKEGLTIDLVKRITEFIEMQKGCEIIDKLTTTTISAAVAFLVDQLKKLVNRLNDDQLAEIEKKKKQIQTLPVKTEQDVAAVQNSVAELKKILPADTQIDSAEAFASWVEDQVDANFDDLIGVGELIVKVLREKKKAESNLQKKKRISDMETYLYNDIQEFRDKLLLLEGTAERMRLYQRIGFALEMIKK